MKGTSFAAVLERTRDGDRSAFATLWQTFQPALLRYLRVTTNDAAEDVASETWAAVASSITRFDGDETAFRA
jgi:DNA-directed RNA polymerase specialized sigma24 family protein